jgi:L-ascorbate 6-phosphate lactonase
MKSIYQPVVKEGIRIQYLGQAGFLLHTGGTGVLIDPYLSDYVISSGIGDPKLFSREFEAPLVPEELFGINFIFITHDHADHSDPLTLGPILKNNPACIVICPRPVVAGLAKLKFSTEKFLVPEIGVDINLGAITFQAIPSAHYELERDRQTGEFKYLGFVLKPGGVVLYHSGDTILYEGLESYLKNAAPRIDIACLPVNGRDKKREALGMVGNLLPEEALHLAQSLGIDLVIPMHNDLFRVNQLDPQSIVELARRDFPDQKVKWMKHGDLLEYKRK